MKKSFRFLTLLLAIGFSVFSLLYADTCNFEFPQNVTYPYGTRPNNFTPAEMKQQCMDWYNKWFAKYIRSKSTYSCMAANEYRLVRWETGTETEDTVSEGVGYAMVIFVFMSSAANNTRQYFDGMYTYYKNHSNGGIMDWRIGSGCGMIGGGGATDSDEDVAWALVAADKQWGSAGAINYHNEAVSLIGKVLASEISASNDLYPGNAWQGGPDNPSYFAPYAYRAFGDYTGVTRWYDVASRSYKQFVTAYYNSSKTYNTALQMSTGLQPNWCNADGTDNVATGYPTDGNFWWDACRHPWRQSYDYLLYGTADHQMAYDNNKRISEFFKAKCLGNAANIKSHYNLNGDEIVWSGPLVPTMGQEDVMNLPGFVGSIGIASMVEGDQAWINNCYYTLVTMDAGTGSGNLTETNVNWGTDYFCDILKMQYLLIMTGNMPNPMGNYPSPTPTNTWNTLTPTDTPTPLPAPGDFDNFETSVFNNLDISATGGGGSIDVTNSTVTHSEGTHSCKVVTTGGNGAWSFFQIDSPYDFGKGYKNYTGATKVEFDINAPLNSTFFIEIIESGVNGGTAGEVWSTRGHPTTIATTGWQHITINLTTGGTNPFGPDQYYTGAKDGNFDLKSVKSIGFQWDAPGNQTIYIDNIIFTGTIATYTPTSTPTNTRTVTKTKTPAGTITFSPTITCTSTNTPFYSPTITATYTVSATETMFISPTITMTPTSTISIPFGVFDNFETGVLESPDQSSNDCTPIYSNSAANPHTGSRSLLIPFASCAPGGWGSYVAVGSPYNTTVSPDFWISFSGATTLTFWVNAPAGTVFFIKIEEWDSGLGGNNPDGEDYKSANLTKIGSGWQLFTVALNTLTQDTNSGRQSGNLTLNTSGIERVGFQFNGGTTGPVYIDDIVFSGMSTPTFTRTPTYTSTASRTPSPTVTLIYTKTQTNTPVNTATNSATATGTPAKTATPTNTVIITNTFTGTATNTGTIIILSATYTPTYTATNINTVTYTGTATLTFTGTFTFTKTCTQTITLTLSITPTHTVSPTATQTITGTPPTRTQTCTYTNTPTSTVTSTATSSATQTGTYTITVTLSNTPVNTTTVTLTNTAVNTATVTLTNTAVNISTAIITYTQTLGSTNTMVPTATLTIYIPPAATPTSTKEPRFFKITEPYVYPCPYNPNAGVDLKIKVTLNKECKKLTLKIYTAGYRRVFEKEFTGSFTGDTQILPVAAENLKKFSNGSYFYQITGETAGNETANTKIKAMIIIK